MHDRIPQKGCVQVDVTFFKFWQISDISETMQNRHIVAMED